MPFVIDNSVVSGWYLEDQATPYTGHIATRLLEERACAGSARFAGILSIHFR